MPQQQQQHAEQHQELMTLRPPKPRCDLDFVDQLRRHFRRRQQLERWSCLLAMLGILLMLVENEVVDAHWKDAALQHRTVEGIKWLILGSTLVLEGLLIWRFLAHTKILLLRDALPPTSNMDLTSSSVAVVSSSCTVWIALWRHFGVQLAVELLICGFFIPPGVAGAFRLHQFYCFVQQDTGTCPEKETIELVRFDQSCYMVYEYAIEAMGVFMIARLYLLVRFMRSGSQLYSPWVALIGSLNDVNSMHPGFHFRAIFKNKPLHVLLPLAFLNSFLNAAVLRILEKPVQPEFTSYWKPLWLVFVTLSATGFGDYYPVTYLGRAFTAVSAMFGGVLLVCLVQAIFFGFMELTFKEKKVKFLIERHLWEQTLKQTAARVIQCTWRLHKTKSNPNATEQQRYRLLNKARRHRRLAPTWELSFEEEMDAFELKWCQEMDTTEATKQVILKRIQSKLDLLQKQRGFDTSSPRALASSVMKKLFTFSK